MQNCCWRRNRVAMGKEYTRAEVSQHKSAESGIWIIIGSSVYNVTKFLEEVSKNSYLGTQKGGGIFVVGQSRTLEYFKVTQFDCATIYWLSHCFLLASWRGGSSVGKGRSRCHSGLYRCGTQFGRQVRIVCFKILQSNPKQTLYPSRKTLKQFKIGDLVKSERKWMCFRI